MVLGKTDGNMDESRSEQRDLRFFHVRSAELSLAE
jgi:hypothetical protein